jgi:hypothetical protein
LGISRQDVPQAGVQDVCGNFKRKGGDGSHF